MQQTIFVTPAPLTLKNHQFRRIGPEDGKREKTACWIESIQVEFSIS